MITLFQEQIKKHSSKLALSDPSTGRTVTYGQLDENARRIAAKLISDGLKHGEDDNGCETEKKAIRKYFAEAVSYEIITE